MPSSKSYVPLAERGWGDVTPIPQADGKQPLVPIMYSAQYRDLMDHFRAVSASGEKSKRVLDLTEEIINLNPAHYTVWQYRYNTLIALDSDLTAELELMTEFATENLKTYQVWHHRLLLITKLSPEDLTSEISFIHNALIPDAKNYHTWAYLNWLFCHFAKLGRVSAERWASELRWCERMIAEDGRNNSAWGWRWFLCMARPNALGAKDPRGEIEYVLNEIHRIPHNASAWNYLRGILRASSIPRTPLLPVLSPYMSGSQVDLPPNNVEDTATWPARTHPVTSDTPTPVPPALEFLADALTESGKGGEAATVYAQLGKEVDQMRAAYWEMRRLECINA